MDQLKLVFEKLIVQNTSQLLKEIQSHSYKNFKNTALLHLTNEKVIKILYT